LAERGVTLFVTTHYMDEAAHCNRLAFIYRGHIIADGTPAELCADYAGDEPDPTIEDVFVNLVTEEERATQTSLTGSPPHRECQVQHLHTPVVLGEKPPGN
jgi:ABC-type multidrug transport system ATPase subunit